MKISLLYIYNIILMTTCPYFDNLKLGIFDAVFLNATLSRLNGELADFRVSNEVQISFLVF